MTETLNTVLGLGPVGGGEGAFPPTLNIQVELSRCSAQQPPPPWRWARSGSVLLEAAAPCALKLAICTESEVDASVEAVTKDVPQGLCCAQATLFGEGGAGRGWAPGPAGAGWTTVPEVWVLGGGSERRAAGAAD